MTPLLMKPIFFPTYRETPELMVPLELREPL